MRESEKFFCRRIFDGVLRIVWIIFEIVGNSGNSVGEKVLVFHFYYLE